MEHKYQNDKNGDIYTVLEEGVLNATNDTEEKKQKMVIYRKGELLFCREEEEFYDKFTVICENGFEDYRLDDMETNY